MGSVRTFDFFAQMVKVRFNIIKMRTLAKVQGGKIIASLSVYLEERMLWIPMEKSKAC